MATPNIERYTNSRVIVNKGYDRCQDATKVDQAANTGCEPGWTFIVRPMFPNEPVCLKLMGQSSFSDDPCLAAGATRLGASATYRVQKGTFYYLTTLSSKQYLTHITLEQKGESNALKAKEKDGLYVLCILKIYVFFFYFLAAQPELPDHKIELGEYLWLHAYWWQFLPDYFPIASPKWSVVKSGADVSTIPSGEFCGTYGKLKDNYPSTGKRYLEVDVQECGDV